MRRPKTPALLAAVALGLVMMPAPAGHADEDTGYERIYNGDFSVGTDAWWTAGTSLRVEDGRGCADIAGGSTNPWDVALGQNEIALEEGQPYTLRFDASASTAKTINVVVQQNAEPWPSTFTGQAELTPTATAFEFTFTSSLGIDNGQVAFHLGGAEDYTFCVDNVSLIGGLNPPEGPDTEPGPPLRANQHGYVVGRVKRASYATEATEPLAWALENADGEVVEQGTTTVHGSDEASQDQVHLVDFSTFDTAGSGYRLRVGEDVSHPFAIAEDLYGQLRDDALAFYYHQRSGVEIEAQYVGEDHARPAGHVDVPPNQGDGDVPCLVGTCDYTLDVTGGWYDAGDHGKYVVNGGISVWQLQNLYERALHVQGGDPGAFADGTLRVPEQANGVPDLLDEARWELEFMLKMQVPPGEDLAGIAHHKIHDQNWTGLPLPPHEDPQPRRLSPPSVTATLNLAAAAAQGARLWRDYDPEFADQLLSAAITAWDAAVAHPDLLPSDDDSQGGGAYSDWRATDEFYWAAAELFITTGKNTYREALTSSEWWYGKSFTADGFSWQSVAALGDLALAIVPNRLPTRDLVGIRESVIVAAEEYVQTLDAQGYPVPYAPQDYGYVWGSNSQVLNNAVVIATAYDLTRDHRFLGAVYETMDYILGRNGLGRSYVTGYGEHDARNQHHRFWANQLDPELPNPPAGSLAGGPNAFLQDPVAGRYLAGCAPQKCYVDDIGSWSTNEVTVNWNAPLAWVTAFLAEQGPGLRAGDCEVDYRVRASWGTGMLVEVFVANNGPEPVDGWTLAWTFPGDQHVEHGWNARISQDGADVTARHAPWNAVIAPGESARFGFLAGHGGADEAPTEFALNGAPCTAS